MEAFSAHIHYRVGPDSPAPLVTTTVADGSERDLRIRFGPPDNYVLIAGSREHVMAWITALVAGLAHAGCQDAASALSEVEERFGVAR